MAKVLRIAGLETKLSARSHKTEKVVKKYEMSSETLVSELEKAIAGYADIQSLVANIDNVARALIRRNFEMLVSELLGHNCNEYDQHRLDNEYREMGLLEPWSEALQKLEDDYNEIDRTEEQKDQDRTARREGRGRIVGGGFGVEGAVKGMAMAGSVNMAAGMAHGTFNLLAKGASSIVAAHKKQALRDSDDTRNNLISGFYEAAWGVTGLHLDIFSREGLDDVLTWNEYLDNVKRAGTRVGLSDSDQLTESKQLALLLEALDLDPGGHEAYVKILKWVMANSKNVKGDVRAVCEYASEFAVFLKDEIQGLFDEKFDEVYCNDALDGVSVRVKLLPLSKDLGIDLQECACYRALGELFVGLEEVSSKFFGKMGAFEKKLPNLSPEVERALAVGAVSHEVFVQWIVEHATSADQEAARSLILLLVKAALSGDTVVLNGPDDIVVEVLMAFLKPEAIKADTDKTIENFLNEGLGAKTDAVAAFLERWHETLGIDMTAIRFRLTQIKGQKKIQEVLRTMRGDYPGENDAQYLSQIRDITQEHNIEDSTDYPGLIAQQRAGDKRDFLAKLDKATQAIIEDEKGKNEKVNTENLELIRRAIKYTDGQKTLESIMEDIRVGQKGRMAAKVKELRQKVDELEDKVDAAGTLKKQALKLLLWAAKGEYESYTKDITDEAILPPLREERRANMAEPPHPPDQHVPVQPESNMRPLTGQEPSTVESSPPSNPITSAHTYVPAPPQISEGSKAQAIISLVLGILSFVLCLGPLGSIPAVILGHLSLSNIKNGKMPASARGMAIAGLIIGYINIAFMALAILGMVGSVGTE